MLHLRDFMIPSFTLQKDKSKKKLKKARKFNNQFAKFGDILSHNLRCTIYMCVTNFPSLQCFCQYSTLKLTPGGAVLAGEKTSFKPS